MNAKPVSARLLLAVMVGLAPLAAVADTLRQHAAHVHGEATGNLSQDGADLRLELEIPGINLVGFEHAPRTPAQQALLDDTLALLNRGDWLTLDPRGDCQVSRINAHTHGFDDAPSDDERGHDHDHSHDGGHGHHHHGHRQADDHGHAHHHGSGQGHDQANDQANDHGHHHGHHHDHAHTHDHHRDHEHHHRDPHDHDHEHAEFHIVARIHCEAVANLRWLDLSLFADFPGNERIVLNVLTDRQTTQVRLQPGRIRVEL